MYKNALITGATGFIGSNLTYKLMELGWNVYVVLRKKTSLGNWRIEQILNNINTIYAEDIFEDSTKLTDIPKIDVCFHLAAYGVDYAQQDVDEMINGNINFTLKLLKFCSKNKTDKILITGSCFEYGSNGLAKIDEHCKVSPQSLYASSKASMVFLANSFADRENLNIVTVRPFGVFGPYEGLHRLIPQIMQTIIDKRPMEMTGGRQVRDYLYIQDLVDAYVLIAEKEVSRFEVFNACSSKAISVIEIINSICKVLNADIKLFLMGSREYRKDEFTYLVGDNSKLMTRLGWEPKVTFENGIINCFNWYKDFLSRYNSEL